MNAADEDHAADKAEDKAADQAMDEGRLGGEITRLLRSHRSEPNAKIYERLVELSYPELRALARRQLFRGRPGETLQTTGLVHEAYMKLVGRDDLDFESRSHFYALMSRVMRQVVIDYARHRSAEKRGGGMPDLELDEAKIGTEDGLGWLLELDDALRRLHQVDERMVRVVECRFFSGYSEQEAAEALDMSLRTVQRTWQRARGWLKHELSG